jgi:hypothetical protein
MTAQSRLAARLAAAVGALGGMAVLAAWIGSASSPIVRDQAAWGAVGVGGTFCVIGACFFWVTSTRQVVALRATTLRAEIAAGASAVRPPSRAQQPVAGPMTLVAAATMVHFHRAGCRLAAGKPVQPAGRHEHEQAGRTPCGVCEP